MLNKILIAFLLMFTLGSCATLINKKGHQVNFSANVPDVKIYNTDHELLGTSPTTLTLKPAATVNLVFEKEGYMSANTELTSSELKGAAFIDAMLFCIPCLIDYPSGNIRKFDKQSVYAILKRKWADSLEKLDLTIQDIQWDISEGYKIGNHLREELIFKINQFDSRSYKESFCKIWSGSPYLVSGCNRDKNFKYVGHGQEISVKPVIKKLQMNISSKAGNNFTQCNMEVDWCFYKGNEKSPVKVIASDIKRTMEGDDRRSVIHSMLSEYCLNLSDDAELYQFLRGVQGQKSMSVNKAEQLAVLTGIRPVFKKTSEMISTLTKSVVTIQHDEGHGSGYIISKDGYLITNYHVIKGKEKVNVMLDQNITLNADVIRWDEQYDIALLKLSGAGFKATYLGNSDSTSVGEEVFCIGTPEDISLGQSVSKGIVSGRRKFEDRIYLQTDVSINSGNSGGPLINDRGEVIGMVTMKLVGKGIEGIGFCIPSNTIREVLQLKELIVKK
ncbi:MAG: trypsin-like peptidase domain-containing protein [Bacteroidia bacterium]|jgi:S1-C subfamily serine protease